LGYDLGYLRHGSFGRLPPGGPADRGAWPSVRWRGLARVPQALRSGALYGLPAALRLPPAAPGVRCLPSRRLSLSR
jgi:hypothetical protein